jgi:hypothetical protein
MHVDSPAVLLGEGVDLVFLKVPAVFAGDEPARVEDVLVDAAGVTGF